MIGGTEVRNLDAQELKIKLPGLVSAEQAATFGQAQETIL